MESVRQNGKKHVKTTYFKTPLDAGVQIQILLLRRHQRSNRMAM